MGTKRTQKKKEKEQDDIKPIRGEE